MNILESLEEKAFINFPIGKIKHTLILFIKMFIEEFFESLNEPKNVNSAIFILNSVIFI